VTTKPVGELRQGAYYTRAIEIAACQPTVKALLLFHVSDEPELDRWQSGIYYADDTPKASLPLVRDAIDRLRGGTPTPCGRVQASLDLALAEQLAKPGPPVIVAKLPAVPPFAPPPPPAPTVSEVAPTPLDPSFP
jgi:hypothetical protein